MLENKKQTLAVIGAGIIGVNCAAELQSLGFDVTLIDKNEIGFGCSERNAGHFATEQVFPLAEFNLLWQMPKLLLNPMGPIALSPSYFPRAIPWFCRFINNMRPSKRSKNTRALQSLNKHAIDYYRQILNSANAIDLLQTQGSLLVFEETPLVEIKKLNEQFQRADIATKLLSREETLALEPNLSNKVNYAIYFTDVGHTSSPLAVCQTIAEYSFSLGCKFIKQEIEKIEERPQGIKITARSAELVNSSTTEQVYDHVVIATGAWSKSVLKQLGYKLPLEVERGYSLDLDRQKSPELNRPVASAERKFIMTPMSHGLRLSGTVEFAGLSKSANMQRADMLFGHAKEMLTEHAPFEVNSANENQRWMGFRPSLPDSLPVIGKATKHQRIYLALGHQHLGLTLGAITGKLIGQLMTSQQPDVDLKPFCISRFN